ncbi:MAG TPA: M23 family metallopeptidase [Flavisolibacter sp.]|nr:M23 family metallopeptidase [Flavisolibacter sp.]
MKNLITIILLVAMVGTSCEVRRPGLFAKRTPHEQYAEKLDDTGLEDTPEGRLWLAASESALRDPQAVQLPYSQKGYFHTDKPRALGLRFTARQGEKLYFRIQRKATASFILYADLFRQQDAGAVHLLSADTASSEFSLESDEAGIYILRLQPELFRTGEYSLSVSVGPSLGFPVSSSKANIGSLWGASRDGGKRRHEGIDIFAPKGSPAVAAADGMITAVREGGIGGKTVWLRPEGKNYTLYYAHLDEQRVREGQQVKKGETLGTVGNTGNARHTPAHLHFGIYTYSGPVDPLVFVNRKLKSAPAIPEKKLTGILKLVRQQKAGNEIVKPDTQLVPLAVNANGYIAELPDGRKIAVPFAAVRSPV